MTVYNLTNLPEGCFYYPDKRELVICCPMADKDQVVLYLTHSLASTAKNMFGRWRVCSDDVRVENDEVATSVDALVQKYLEAVVTMNKIVHDKKNSPEAVSKRRWERMQIGLFLGCPAMLLIALAIAAIVLCVYYPIWFT